MKKNSMQVLYVSIGIFNLAIAGFILFVGLMANTDPVIAGYSSPLMVAVISFCMAYLYPQFKQKDERMKLIRQKGMFYSYFALLFYFAVFIIIVEFQILALTAKDILYSLMTLTVSTVFISWVILARRN